MDAATITPRLQERRPAAFAFYMPHTRFEDMYRPHKKQEAAPAETKTVIDDADVPSWGNGEVEL